MIEKDETKNDLFYVRYAGQDVDGLVLWWRPNRSGYTTNLSHAGVYGADFSSGRPEDVLVPTHVADKLAVGVVDAGILDIKMKEINERREGESQ